MLAEGIIVNDNTALMKSTMLREIGKLKRTDPKSWQDAVFRTLTGHSTEEIDWDFEDNHAGYYSWVKSFDQLVKELVKDGYVSSETSGANGEKFLVANEVDPAIEYSYQSYPGSKS